MVPVKVLRSPGNIFFLMRHAQLLGSVFTVPYLARPNPTKPWDVYPLSESVAGNKQALFFVDYSLGL